MLCTCVRWNNYSVTREIYCLFSIFHIKTNFSAVYVVFSYIPLAECTVACCSLDIVDINVCCANWNICTIRRKVGKTLCHSCSIWIAGDLACPGNLAYICQNQYLMTSLCSWYWKLNFNLFHSILLPIMEGLLVSSSLCSVQVDNVYSSSW